MASRVVLDLDQLKELTYTPGMSAMLLGKAQAVVAAARSRAPVKTGRYARSFTIAPAVTDRKVIRVFNGAPWALSVEYGGSKTGKSRPLGTALEAAGLADVRFAGATRKAARAKATRSINKRTGTSVKQRKRIKRLRAKHGSR